MVKKVYYANKESLKDGLSIRLAIHKKSIMICSFEFEQPIEMFGFDIETIKVMIDELSQKVQEIESDGRLD